MLYRICKFAFSTPVRFGSDEGGDLLTGARMNAHSDTLFSALYISLMPVHKEDKLLMAVKEGKLAFSDTLPYRGEELYIPRPMGIKGPEAQLEDPAMRKKMKRVEYIPFSKTAEYMEGKLAPDALMARFAVSYDTMRVNLRDFEESLPYSVSAFRFLDGCGLYTVVRAESETELKLFEEAVTLLSCDGFGGKVSSGLGKFDYSVSAPDELMEKQLADESAGRQILLSCALPGESEGETALGSANYVTVRRGGFTSPAGGRVYKRRTHYLLAPGSVFEKRFAGSMLDASEEGEHPVWRYAMGVFMGVSDK